MFGTSWQVGRIAGIQVRVDSSWVVIALLITYSMYLRFAFLYKDLSTGAAAGIAILAAVLFFGSILVHELAHALVSRARGIQVQDITLFQAANANLNPWTEAKVDTKNPGRGPLLIIDGEMDHTVPWAIANAAYKRQKRNPGVTEIVKIPGRGHSLTIDHRWREVADTALAFIQKHAQP